MGIFRPGAHGLNCARCGLDLHGEQEVQRGLCDLCMAFHDDPVEQDLVAGERWLHRLLSTVRAMPDHVAHDALRAPKDDLPEQVARAVEILIQWRLDTPSDRDDRR